MSTFPLSNNRPFHPARLALALLALTVLISGFAFWQSGSLAPALLTVGQAVPADIPLAFIPGQNGRSFETVGSAATFHPNEVVFNLPAASETAASETIRLQFANAAQPVLVSGQQLAGVVNNIQGNDASQWRTDLPTYAGITYQNLYPGIDLAYEGTDGRLKGTYFVAPGANPAQIQWQYSGASAVAVDARSGDLNVSLPAGAGLTEQAPIAWQTIAGKRVPVEAAFSVGQNGLIGFQLGAYNNAYPLAIDPTIVYKKIFNAAFLDHGVDAAVDADGNAHVVAYLYANNFSQDILVLKLDPAGNVIYYTILSGQTLDEVRSVAATDSGDTIIFGRSLSSDFPIVNAMQPTMNGSSDSIIVKLSGTDGSLMFSTFFGGDRNEIGFGLDLAPNGDIVVIGSTGSTDFPTVNPIQGGLILNECFCDDAFISRISPDGSTLLYSTYLGGTFRDWGMDVAVDEAGNIYYAGITRSDDFPTANPIQATYGGGDEDVFAGKLSPDGSTMLYGTYLGGSDLDLLGRITVADNGRLFLTGTTRSINFPTTPGAYQTQFVGGINACGTGTFDPIHNCEDVFVTSIVPDGSALVYSTFLAGTLIDEASSIAIDRRGAAYIIGNTSSTDFPPNGGNQYYIFVSKLTPNGSQVKFTLKANSGSYNAGHGIAIAPDGDIVLTGAINVPADLLVVRVNNGSALTGELTLTD